MTDRICRVSVAEAFAAAGLRPPFRVAATSFVIPDSVRANCLYLKDYFPEVGLVLFELESCLAYGPDDWPEPPTATSAPLSANTVSAPEDSARQCPEGLRPELLGPALQRPEPQCPEPQRPEREGRAPESHTAQSPDYHLHLPLDLPWHRGMDEVWQGLSALLRQTAPLRPRAHVLHPPPDPALLAPLARRFAHAGIDTSDVLLENIREDDLTATWEVARPLGYGLCLDIGHILSYGQGGALELEGTEGRVGMVHAYAPKQGSGHASLALLDDMDGGPETLDRALALLRPGGTVTLEVFREAELFESLMWLAKHLSQTFYRAKWISYNKPNKQDK